jgi:hypothetical protein
MSHPCTRQGNWTHRIARRPRGLLSLLMLTSAVSWGCEATPVNPQPYLSEPDNLQLPDVGQTLFTPPAPCTVDASLRLRVPNPRNITPSTLIQGAGQFPVVAGTGSDLAVVFRGAGSHVDINGRLDMAFSADNGHSWGGRMIAVDGPLDDRNPAFARVGGSLLLAYAVYHSAQQLTSYVVRSADNGATWTTPEAINVAPFPWSSPYGKIIDTGEELILPMYGSYHPVLNSAKDMEPNRGFYSFVVRSRDGGVTWSAPEVIGRFYNEAAVIALSPNELIAAVRHSVTSNLVLARWTRATGQWVIECSLTGYHRIPGDFVQLPDRSLLLTYGQRRKAYGIGARLSVDGGRSWSAPRLLVRDGADMDMGYPSSVVVGDSVLTLYYVDKGVVGKTAADAAAGRELRGIRYPLPGRKKPPTRGR